VWPPAQPGQLRGQQRRLEAGAEIHRGAGQPLRQLEVVPPAGDGGGLQHLVGGRAAALQPPHRGAQHVLAPGRGTAQRVRELAGDVLRAQPRRGSPQDVSVERVRQPELQAALARRRHQQALALQRLGDPQVAQQGQLTLGERLAVREQFQHRPLGGAQRADLALDQLDQPVGRGQRPGQVPHPRLPAKRPVLRRVLHHGPQEQHVALAADREERDRRRIDLATQHRRQQLVHRRAVQAADVDPVGQLVLPERGHRVGHVLAGPHGGQHEDLAPDHRLVDQGGRRVVEQVGVVDQQQQTFPVAGLLHGTHVAAQQVGTVVDPAVVDLGEHRRQRPERDLPGGPGAADPAGHRPPVGGPAHDFAREPGLAHPGRADQHHPPAVRRGDPALQQLEVGAPPDQRPLLHRSFPESGTSALSCTDAPRESCRGHRYLSGVDPLAPVRPSQANRGTLRTGTPYLLQPGTTGPPGPRCRHPR
jgi:hypothetical protein